MPNPVIEVQKIENNFRKMLHDKFVPMEMRIQSMLKKLDEINILTRVTFQNRIDSIHKDLQEIIGIPGPYEVPKDFEGGTFKVEVMRQIKQNLNLLTTKIEGVCEFTTK